MLTFEERNFVNPRTIGLHFWTVAIFPNGEWTTGGAPTDADYADSEVLQVYARDRRDAKVQARNKRRRKNYKRILGRDYKR